MNSSSQALHIFNSTQPNQNRITVCVFIVNKSRKLKRRAIEWMVKLLYVQHVVQFLLLLFIEWNRFWFIMNIKKGMIVGLLNLLWISFDAFDSWFLKKLKFFGLNELDAVDGGMLLCWNIMLLMNASYNSVYKGDVPSYSLPKVCLILDNSKSLHILSANFHVNAI